MHHSTHFYVGSSVLVMMIVLVGNVWLCSGQSNME